MKKYLWVSIVPLFVACSHPMLKFEQYSVAMRTQVSVDSTISIGKEDHFTSVLHLNPILKQENVAVQEVRLIENYGRYYLCAEQFKHLWFIEPQGDGQRAKYKAIDVTPKDPADRLSEIGFARFGSDEKSCVRFRYNKTEIFIDMKGSLNETCK